MRVCFFTWGLGVEGCSLFAACCEQKQGAGPTLKQRHADLLFHAGMLCQDRTSHIFAGRKLEGQCPDTGYHMIPKRRGPCLFLGGLHDSLRSWPCVEPRFFWVFWVLVPRELGGAVIQFARTSGTTNVRDPGPVGHGEIPLPDMLSNLTWLIDVPNFKSQP